MPSPKSMMRLDEALERVAALPLSPLEFRAVPLMEALDKVLAEDVVSPLNIPPCDNSAMDGYAVCGADLDPKSETRLTVAFRITAGDNPQESLSPGQAARIFTGASIPKGADVVVMQEQCRVEGDDVIIPAAVKMGANIRRAGQDVTRGSTPLKAGTRLESQHLAMGAAVGRGSLSVYFPVRVAVLSSGDELRDPGQGLPEGCINDSNRYGVMGLVRSLGGLVVDLGILPDQPDLISKALTDAATCSDLIVTSGGMSVGEEDHMRKVVSQLGKLDFWKIAIKPGKPLGVGDINGVPVLGLPGNPVSAFVTFLLIGRPLLLRLAGQTKVSTHSYKVRAGFSHKIKGTRREFLRGQLSQDGNADLNVSPFHTASSGVLSSLTGSDGLIDLGDDCAEVREGDLVEFIPFSSMRRGP